jgi:hypothetical protein
MSCWDKVGRVMFDELFERKKQVDQELAHTTAYMQQLNEQKMQLKGQSSILKVFETQLDQAQLMVAPPQ